jgi:hypothetical protein
MTSQTVFRALALLACGAVLGQVVAAPRGAAVLAQAPAQADKPQPDLASLQSEVAALRSIAPTQSHVMADVAIQYGSLWFAGSRRNWPLALYYFNESRNRMNWAIRINPAVKAQGTGEIVDLKGIFDGIDSGSLAPLRRAIETKDSVGFGGAYKVMLESCYSCHKAVGRPYLRPMVPLSRPQPIINIEPNAIWPK